MRRLAAILALGAGLACSACQSGPDVVYTGTNEDAAEGAWIKDPAAEGTTRGVSREEQTRTRSNRIDIPVREFVQLSVTSSTRTIARNSGIDARYVRTLVVAGWLNRYAESRSLSNEYGSRSRVDALLANANETRYPAAWAEETINARLGRQGARAYSAIEQPWAAAGSVPGDAIHTSTWARAMKSESYAEAAASQAGYTAAWGARVVGLHLWKYADRELVADSVEVTYTIVYYNMNDHDIGPTEIIEPVPYYTEYIDQSATLPKEGTSVARVQSEGERAYLRWSFPKGIKAGETNQMTYKVRVQLDTRYVPPEDKPGVPPRQ